MINLTLARKRQKTNHRCSLDVVVSTQGLGPTGDQPAEVVLLGRRVVWRMEILPPARYTITDQEIVDTLHTAKSGVYL